MVYWYISKYIVAPAAIAKHALPADDNQKLTAYWKSVMAHSRVLIL